MPLLLVLLAIAVSIWWLIASNMAAKEFDRIRSAEATRGRLWSCGEIAMGGFPFRIEAECRQAKLMVLGDHPTTITANRYVVVSQIYQPSLLLLEIDSMIVLFFLALLLAVSLDKSYPSGCCIQRQSNTSPLNQSSRGIRHSDIERHAPTLQ